jgi:hypothetical protein
MNEISLMVETRKEGRKERRKLQMSKHWKRINFLVLNDFSCSITRENSFLINICSFHAAAEEQVMRSERERERERVSERERERETERDRERDRERERYYWSTLFANVADVSTCSDVVYSSHFWSRSTSSCSWLELNSIGSG